MILRFCLVTAASAALLAAQRLPESSKRTDEQVAAAERKLKQAPNDAALMNGLAGRYLQKLRETADGTYLDRAARLVERVLETDPSNYDARRNRLTIEMQRHHFKQVAAAAAELRRERPEDAVAWALEGDAWMEMGAYRQAESAYQKMADLRPNLASYNRIAFFRFVTGDAQGAIEALRQGIRMGAPAAENVAWCLADLGHMLFKTGALQEAEKAYAGALALFPGAHHALAGVGRVLAAREKFAEAVEAFQKAQTRVPLPEYTGSLAKLYRRLGQPDQAAKQIALLDVADALGKAAGESANRDLAIAFADLGHRTGRALELARAELEIRRDVYTYDALAWALFKNGKLAEAAEAMEKALMQSTPEPSFHAHAAEICEALGRADEAERHRRTVAALNPGFDVAHSPRKSRF